MNSPVRCALAGKGLPPSFLSVRDFEWGVHSQICLLYLFASHFPSWAHLFPASLELYLAGGRKYCVGVKRMLNLLLPGNHLLLITCESCPVLSEVLDHEHTD